MTSDRKRIEAILRDAQAELSEIVGHAVTVEAHALNMAHGDMSNACARLGLDTTVATGDGSIRWHARMPVSPAARLTLISAGETMPDDVALCARAEAGR